MQPSKGTKRRTAPVRLALADCAQLLVALLPRAHHVPLERVEDLDERAMCAFGGP
jgi:hypothetical protein